MNSCVVNCCFSDCSDIVKNFRTPTIHSVQEKGEKKTHLVSKQHKTSNWNFEH